MFVWAGAVSIDNNYLVCNLDGYCFHHQLDLLATFEWRCSRIHDRYGCLFGMLSPCTVMIQFGFCISWVCTFRSRMGQFSTSGANTRKVSATLCANDLRMMTIRHLFIIWVSCFGSVLFLVWILVWILVLFRWECTFRNWLSQFSISRALTQLFWWLGLRCIVAGWHIVIGLIFANNVWK